MLMLTQKLFKLIPNSYPIQCEDGWLLEVNENETRINCTNRLCPIDNAMKLDKALDLLGVNYNVGPSRAISVITNLQLENHMDIFNKAYEIYQEGYEFMDSLTGYDKGILNATINFINQMEDYPVDLYKFIQSWGLEQLGSTNSQNVFREIDSLEEFYSNVDSNDFWLRKFLSEKLNISHSSNTVIKIESFLLENRDTILYTARNFIFKEKKTGTINITITGEVSKAIRSDGSKYKPRIKFAEEMSDRYDININYTAHITQDTDFLICDSDNGHTKINKVKNNPAFKKVQAISSSDFEDYMKKLTFKGNPNKIKAFK